MKTHVVFLILFACLVPLGCSSDNSSRVPVYKVTGKITYKGAPVAGADVTFNCTEANRSAFGRTNEEGVYKLTTFSSNDGAVDGKHSVTVQQAPPSKPAAPVASVETDQYVPPEMDLSTDPIAPKSTLPAMYSDPVTSGLIAVVNKDGENVIDFPLE